MARRICVPRLSEGSHAAPASEGSATKMFDPPAFAGLRVVFGVGNPAGDPPDNDTFKPTYVLSVPVFSMGGLDPDGVYRKRGPARVFVSERAAIAAIKGHTERPVQPNDVVVGPFHIGSARAEVTASTDGTVDGAHGAGHVAVSDATVAGVPVTIGPDGVVAHDPARAGEADERYHRERQL